MEGTIQQQMKASLETVGLPFKDVQCYGSQIVITCVSRDTANRWVPVLRKFSTVRGVIECLDEKADSDFRTPTSQKYTRVHRVYAVISGSNRVSGKAGVATQHESAQTMAHSGSAAGVSSHPVHIS
jgi:hypothetical protein